MKKEVIVRSRMGRELAEHIKAESTPGKEILRLHDGIMRQAASVRRDILLSAIRIGELLYNQKKALPHGEFIPWVQANIESIGIRQAQSYMKAYDHRKMLQSSSFDSLRSITAYLSAPAKTKRASHLTDKLLPVIDGAMLLSACGGDQTVFAAVKKRLSGYFDIQMSARKGIKQADAHILR